VAIAILVFLPWGALFGAFVGSALGNRWGIQLGGSTLRGEEGVLVAFAIRAFLFTDRRYWPKFGLPEALLAGFIFINVLSTYFFARVLHSLVELGILTLGATTYLAVSTSVCTPERLRKAARLFLALGALSAGVGIISFAGHYVGLGFGVDNRYTPAIHGAPAIKGLAWEHDIFGSTCAAVAFAFYVLRRERSTLFTSKWTDRFFWMSAAGLVLSQARGAWLAYGAVYVGYRVIWSRRHRRQVPPRMVRTAVILSMVGLIGLGGLWAATQAGQVQAPSPVVGLVVTTFQKIGTALNFSSTSTCDGCNTAAARLRRLNKGYSEVMASSPVIGLGTDSYGERNFRPSPFTSPYLAPAYIEVLYGRTIYDTGVLGLILLVWFLGWLAWPRRDVMRGTTEAHQVARALTFAAAIVVIAYGITDGTFFMWPWILWGLSRAANRIARSTAAPAPEGATEPAVPSTNGHANGNGRPGLAGVRATNGSAIRPLRSPRT